MCLTQDTSNASHLTLNSIVSLIKLLLNKDFNYVFPGSFQNDRLEREFCIFCQSAEIMNSLVLQRIKLFSRLNIEKVVIHAKKECWTVSLTDGEIFILHEAFSLRRTLSDIEESSLFYISGYVAFKEGLALKDAVDDSNHFKNSELLLLLSQVKYKNVEKTRINHLIIGLTNMKGVNWNTSHISLF